MKLPAFYLLDAISKNIYDPYGRHFSPIVSVLFVETYSQVDPATRSKMEEMILTWRTGAPNGRELFGISPQVAIERGIWGSGSNNNVSDTALFLVTNSLSSTIVLRFFGLRLEVTSY
jgi:pre-mRNA cleavage complex 2 protein Pcf11